MGNLICCITICEANIDKLWDECNLYYASKSYKNKYDYFVR